VFDELLSIAARAGLEVRTRTFRGKAPFAGGLCTVLGQRVILLNAQASPVERSVALADALAQASLTDSEMSPEARRFLTTRTRSRSGIVEPENAPRPGLAKAVSAPKKKPHER
jgi:hypothetical protein